MEPNKKIDIALLMNNLRNAVSAHINRNVSRHFSTTVNEEQKEAKAIEDLPQKTNRLDTVKVSWMNQPRTNLNGWPTNLSIGRNGVEQHVEIRKDGGQFY